MTTITINWSKSEVVHRTYTATVDLDDLPDDLIVPLDENHWCLDAGQTRSADVDTFLAELEASIRRARERSVSIVRFVDREHDVAPEIMVVAPPVPAITEHPEEN